MAESADKASKASWLAPASALLSVIACYGTLAAVALLSMMGVTLALNERVWAGVIVAFAVLAVAALSFGYARHGNPNPSRLAIAGAALVFWAMYGADNIREMVSLPPTVVELAGFAALLGAAWWDWKVKRQPD